MRSYPDDPRTYIPSVSFIGHSLTTIHPTQIYAVYECNRRLLVLFCMFFVAEIACTLAVVDVGLPQSILRQLLWPFYRSVF
jgi:hypothetical protein